MTNLTRGKKLVLLLGILLVLMAVTILVMELVPDESAQEETAVTIFTLDMDQVTTLSWAYEGEEVSLERDGENNWTYPADDTFPLDQTYPDAMVQTLSEIQADRIIEDPEDLSEYGLADPVCAITVQAGESRELAIGDETSLGGGSATSPWVTATSTWWTPACWMTSPWACMTSWPRSPSPP
ncbi:MAG TPA: DUF4340 domain-containing protein [Candidatus Evtepia faecigallinarum]|nr:DUF4340 domain-containing protein [Candidatus Evtepia faecigallinarum]